MNFQPNDNVLAKQDMSMLGISTSIVGRGTSGKIVERWASNADLWWVKFDGFSYQIPVESKLLTKKG